MTTWTTEPPAEPGFYWAIDPSGRNYLGKEPAPVHLNVAGETRVVSILEYGDCIELVGEKSAVESGWLWWPERIEAPALPE